jgi:hypothetical protein
MSRRRFRTAVHGSRDPQARDPHRDGEPRRAPDPPEAGTRTHLRVRFKNITGQPVKTLFLFTPAGPEDLFVEGGDDPRPGERPVVWDMERVAQIAGLVESTGLTVLPEA